MHVRGHDVATDGRTAGAQRLRPCIRRPAWTCARTNVSGLGRKTNMIGEVATRCARTDSVCRRDLEHYDRPFFKLCITWRVAVEANAVSVLRDAREKWRHHITGHRRPPIVGRRRPRHGGLSVARQGRRRPRWEGPGELLSGHRDPTNRSPACKPHSAIRPARDSGRRCARSSGVGGCEPASRYSSDGGAVSEPQGPSGPAAIEYASGPPKWLMTPPIVIFPIEPLPLGSFVLRNHIAPSGPWVMSLGNATLGSL